MGYWPQKLSVCFSGSAQVTRMLIKILIEVRTRRIRKEKRKRILNKIKSNYDYTNTNINISNNSDNNYYYDIDNNGLYIPEYGSSSPVKRVFFFFSQKRL